MGRLAKGLRVLMSNQPEGTSSAARPVAGRSFDDMDVLELIYQMCKCGGQELAGDPARAFAAFNPTTGKLRVYSTPNAQKNAYVQMIACDSVTMLAALEHAQEQGASFMVVENEVVCSLSGTTARGRTYPEAALRAIAKQMATTRS